MSVLTRRAVFAGLALLPACRSVPPAPVARSDDFRAGRLDPQWSFTDPSPSQTARLQFDEAGVFFRGQGGSAVDSPAIVCRAADRAFEAQITIDLYDGAEGGLLLAQSGQIAGIGFAPHLMKAYAGSQAQVQASVETQSVRIAMICQRAATAFRYSHDDGRTWTPHPLTAPGVGDADSRIGLFSAGAGQVRLRDFTYRSLGQAQSAPLA